MDALRRTGTALALAGGLTFIAVLYFSAYFEPDIRWLHFLQSWMYIASLVLILRRSKWGCFIGATAAFFWNYVNVFVTTFFRNGIEQLQILSRTGHVPRPESLISVPAWFGNLGLILGAVLVYIALPRKQWSTLAVCFLPLQERWPSLRDQWSLFSLATYRISELRYIRIGSFRSSEHLSSESSRMDWVRRTGLCLLNLFPIGKLKCWLDPDVSAEATLSLSGSSPLKDIVLA